MGHAPQALNEREFEQVRRFVDVLRADDQEPLQDAIEWLLRRSTDVPVVDDHGVLREALFDYANDCPHETIGVLARVFGQCCIEDLSDEETEVLQQTLSVLRNQGWFSDWLKLQVEIIAAGKSPDDRYPTPLRIAASLVDCIREHDEQMEAARDMVRMRPDLLFPVPVEPQATPEPPAVSEVDQVRKETTERPRARNRRKKASHA